MRIRYMALVLALLALTGCGCSAAGPPVEDTTPAETAPAEIAPVKTEPYVKRTFDAAHGSYEHLRKQDRCVSQGIRKS